MRNAACIVPLIVMLTSCSDDNYQPAPVSNPEVTVAIPPGFPVPNAGFSTNPPTQYGVMLGKQLFEDKRLSGNNSISCSSCHVKSQAFADNNVRGIGVEGRIGLRNVPPIQNMAFMNFYNWDGSKLLLERQPLVPIITHEEMDSSILEVIGKLENDPVYIDLFRKAFGDQTISPERIYKSIAQYEYTLISANSKYDKVKRNESEAFTESESRGYLIFQQKCVQCHNTELFTDQSFRNIGFPLNTDSNEAGRARVTGLSSDYMAFRVPSLRNIALTAPYGSFGQFPTLRSVLDYFDNGVLEAINLDPVFKNNGNRIPLTQEEKVDLIAFLKTLTDEDFVN